MKAAHVVIKGEFLRNDRHDVIQYAMQILERGWGRDFTPEQLRSLGDGWAAVGARHVERPKGVEGHWRPPLTFVDVCRLGTDLRVDVNDEGVIKVSVVPSVAPA